MTIAATSALIGQLFARSTIGQTYQDGRRDGGGEEEAPPLLHGSDIVELSVEAPRPVEANMLLEAEALARKLAAREGLSGGEEESLREGRVVAAMVVLAAVERNRGDLDAPVNWPGGLPAPNREELAEAYRRVRQRLSGVQETREAEKALRLREQIVEYFREADFGALADEVVNPLAAA